MPENTTTNVHSLSIDEVFKQLNSRTAGLSSEEATGRLKKYGENELPEKKKEHPVVTFLRQFNNFLIYILLAATAISFYLGQYVDAYLILAIIVINAVIGFVQEYRAEKSIAALKELIVPTANVYRDGELKQLKARMLVPGDVIFLQEGDRIPADARIFEADNLRCVESSLTGESLPVVKEPEEIPPNTALADRKNMVFMGTYAAGGQATAVVTATGLNTALGEVAQSLEDVETSKGHFEKRINKLGIQLGFIATGFAVLTFIIGYFVRGFDFAEIFLFTLASLVAGIPEGLPAVIAVVLAIGAYRMARQNAVIRKLPATETLGHATVIATDKTGTLTQNTMNVEHVVLADGTDFKISGKGWETKGQFFLDNEPISPLENSALQKLLYIAGFCNNSQLVHEDGNIKIIGDPTEASLVVMAEKAGLHRSALREREKKISDQPFNKELRYRASLVELKPSGERQLYFVGAPETILELSAKHLSGEGVQQLSDKLRKAVNQQIERLSHDGMRVLGLAFLPVKKSIKKVDEQKIHNDLVFAGLVGMKDPPRMEVRESIETAKKAGIRVVMKTGDHKGTALAIAREIGLITEKEGKDSPYEQAYTEEELKAFSDEELVKVLHHVNVFARLTPKMKLQLTDVFQKSGEVVAMTGDGVNDAPALKKADIGIAMGVIGTDVARASSEMVLADDNFASIMKAVKEGRIVFRNISHATYFLLVTNVAEAITILTALTAGYELPLLPVHILWLNLITDGIVVLALAAEPGQGDEMKRKPKKEKVDILTWSIVPYFLIMAGIMTVETIYIFDKFLADGLDKARTGAFAILAIAQLFNVLNMRSLDRSVFKIGVFSNKYLNWAIPLSALPLVVLFYIPFLRDLFRFVPLSAMEFLEIVLLGSIILWMGELYKLVLGWIKKQ